METYKILYGQLDIIPVIYNYLCLVQIFIKEDVDWKLFEDIFVMLPDTTFLLTEKTK